MIQLHLNGISYGLKWIDFSDGASGVSLVGKPPHQIESAFITCISDGGLHDNLFNIGQVLDVVRGINPRVKTTLFLPYVPYARADRHMVNHDSFGLKVFARTLNMYKFDRVVVIDPHSDVAPALINNCEVISQSSVISSPTVREWLSAKDYTLVAPDEGSLKKVGKVAEVLDKKSFVTLTKTRNPATGEITGIKILGDVSEIAGKDFLIVDDICDGGGTFIGAAAALYEAGASSVDLYITHGIFSKGLKPLFDGGIVNIFTTDSVKLLKEESENLSVLECKTLYLQHHIGGFR